MATVNSPGKPIWITEVGESILSIELIWRAHIYSAAKGISRMYWYNYDTGTASQQGGFQNMQITNYPGMSLAYMNMISSCQGKVCAYVNRRGATGGQIGANINGVSILY